LRAAAWTGRALSWKALKRREDFMNGFFAGVDRRALLRAIAALPLLPAAAPEGARAEQGDADALPSWSEGLAKAAIVALVRDATDPKSPAFVPREARIAAFDQDGTSWVEHPVYSQLIYCFDRIPDLVEANPKLRDEEPFRTVLSGDRAAMSALGAADLEKIAVATLTGMDVEVFRAEVEAWLDKARDPRWKRPFTDLVYLPMLEVMRYLRANGFKIYFVTGGGQDFVRAYSERTYGVPPEQVVGSALGVSFGFDDSGKRVLIKQPKLLLNDDKAGKPEGIHLMIGRRPVIAFGNSTGDREMLEYVTAGSGPRLGLLVLHDDPVREYAYGPARGLPDTKVGTFPPELDEEAKRRGWQVISMKNDWKKIFAFEERP